MSEMPKALSPSELNDARHVSIYDASAGKVLVLHRDGEVSAHHVSDLPRLEQYCKAKKVGFGGNVSIKAHQRLVGRALAYNVGNHGVEPIEAMASMRAMVWRKGLFIGSLMKPENMQRYAERCKENAQREGRCNGKWSENDRSIVASAAALARQARELLHEAHSDVQPQEA